MPFLIALGLSVVATPLAGLLGRAAGMVDRPGPDELKVHPRPVPFTGGLAVVLATVAALALTAWTVRGPVVGGIVAALALGMADDARPLPPWLRLILQTVVGVVVAWALPLPFLGPFGGAAMAAIVVATVNAVNLLDGQDGLAGGVAAIAAVSLAIVTGASNASNLGMALAGALAGFVVWNRPPARIFLGDGGAYAVGVALAALAAASGRLDGVRGALAAALCLGVPALELVLTIIRRLRTGSRVVGGDRLHSYDRLTSRRGVWWSTLAFWGLGAAAGALGILVASVSLGVALAVVAGVSVAAIAAGLALRPDARPGRVRQSR
jgi:UDP-GlcNAc:undecaprenyl-phosphate GlcNAc-1-phosphate transferase